MLLCVEHWTTSREEFFEFSLVEMNDQVFDGNRLKILTLLVAPEDRSRLAESLICLDGDLLRRISQRGFGYADFLAIARRFLVRVNGQCLSSRPEGLIVTLRCLILSSGEYNSPAESPSCFPLILQRGKLTKKCRGAKLQVILCRKKITSRSPLRFWRSVPIGVWSAHDHFVPLTM